MSRARRGVGAALAAAIRVGVVVGVGASGCGPKPPPPVPFVDSPAFAEVERRAYGLLRWETEAVVVERDGAGYVPVLFRRDEEGTWRRACAGPVLEGDELEAVRVVEMVEGSLVLVVAASPTPDLLEQRVVLLDLAADCAVRYLERVRLPVPGEVIAVGPVPAGVRVHEPGIRIIDRPRFLRLEGADGEVGILLGARARQVTGTQQEIQVWQARPSYLVPRSVKVRWRPAAGPTAARAAPDGADALADPPQPGTEPRPPEGEDVHPPPPDPEPPPASGNEDAHGEDPKDLPELSDGDAHTSFVIRAGEAGALVVESSEPVLLLDLAHGCPGSPPAALELRQGDRRYVTGTVPQAGSFVRASGRTHRDQGSGAQRDLLAVASPQTTLEIALDPSPDPRCLRQVRAFGTAIELPEAPPESVPQAGPTPEAPREDPGGGDLEEVL